MQRNRNKILAVFSVVLMVAFLIPTFGGGTGGSSQDVAWATTASGKVIHRSDIETAANQWRLLQQVVIGSEANERPVAIVLGQWGYFSILQRPELFYLLSLEAQQSGIDVAPEVVDYWMENVKVKDPDGGRRLGSQSHQARAVREAIYRLLLIDSNFQQASGVLKASVPARQLMLSQLGQQLDIQCVQYTAGEFAGRVPAATDEQLRSQFFSHSSEPGNPGSVAANPMGFGYRLPDEVKFQYIEIPREAVREAVLRQAPDPADPAQTWDEKVAAKYYSSPSDYRYRLDDPLGESPFELGNLPLALMNPLRPTTRPFDEVLSQIKSKLLVQPMDELQRKIEQAIAALLDKDYARYAAVGTTLPTSGPSLLGGVPFTSVEYLREVRDRMEKQYGVRVKIASFDHLMSAAQISELEGIGALQAPTPDASGGGRTFGQWLAQSAEGIAGAAAKDVIKMFKPTAWLKDAGGSSYLARVTQSQASKLPDGGVADPLVREKVAADWTLAQGQELAHSAAEGLMAEAAKLGSLQSAANAAPSSRPASGPATRPAGRPVISLKGVSVRAAMPLAELHLSDLSQQALIGDLYDKLLPLAANEDHPRVVIDLPRDRKVVAVELEHVEPLWSSGYERVARELDAAQGLAMSQAEMFAADWFNPDHNLGVYARLGLKIDASAQGSGEE